MKDVSDIVAWLESRTSREVGGELVQGLCARITAAGVPLARAGFFVTTLDPDVAGLSFVWSRGASIEQAEISHELMRSELYLNSPLTWIQRVRKPLRRRLNDGSSAEFPFLTKLYSEGFTDYFATPLQFTNDEVHIAGLERLGFRTVITSAEFARISSAQLVPVGSYMLRGITTAQPVFGLPEDDGAPEKPVQSLVCEL